MDFNSLLVNNLIGIALGWLGATCQYHFQNKNTQKQLLRETANELRELVSQTIIPFWMEGIRDQSKEMYVKMQLSSISNKLMRYSNLKRQMQILRMRCTGETFETAEFGKNSAQTQTQIELINRQWELLDRSMQDLSQRFF